jgi:23S rRNA (uracil1939-C5)-methyltransferase
LGRKKNQLPFFEKVEITDLAAEGKAIVRINDMVCFVNMLVPGDIVDLQIIKKRKKYMEGRVTAFHKYSDIRQEPFCKHFGTCGGCKWQHLPYPLQLKFKQQQVFDTLSRIGKIELPEIREILGSENDTFYRNKLEYTFSNHRWLSKEEIGTGEEIKDTRALGFHIPGLFDKIVDVEKCWLQEDPSNEIRNILRDFVLKNNYSFFSQREHGGLLRNLIIRTSISGEVMVIVVFYDNEPDLIEKILNHLYDKVKGISSLMYAINQKGNDTLYDQEIIVFKGEDHIFENLEDLKFKIGPKSFFQTNSKQALELYKVSREFADLTGDEIVYDLYTGTGTIANFVARKAKKVIGIESVPEAIEDAFVNSRINGITNTDFFAGDMKDLLNEEFIEKHGNPDVIITDPPRAGMHKNVIDSILNASPKRIVYVSCNPSTQARDLELLSEKYKVTAVQPVDMFPHTHHVENVVRLELN